jgi:hypothetical protein
MFQLWVRWRFDNGWVRRAGPRAMQFSHCPMCTLPVDRAHPPVAFGTSHADHNRASYGRWREVGQRLRDRIGGTGIKGAPVTTSRYRRTSSALPFSLTPSSIQPSSTSPCGAVEAVAVAGASARRRACGARVGRAPASEAAPRHGRQRADLQLEHGAVMWRCCASSGWGGWHRTRRCRDRLAPRPTGTGRPRGDTAAASGDQLDGSC